jgi:hypothetical protein
MEPEPAAPSAKCKGPTKPSFPVATWAALGLRAYFDVSGTPHWLFERVHQQLDVQSEGGFFLRRNQDALKQLFRNFSVPESDFGYKAADREHNEQEPWADHTLTSRGLLLYFFFQLKHRRSPVKVKAAAMAFLQKLTTAIFAEHAAQASTVGITVEDDFGVVNRAFLEVSAQGVARGWLQVANMNSAATELWQNLQNKAWCGMKITSTLETATLQDILFFMAYLMGHTKERLCSLNPYETVCKHVLPELLLWLGNLMDEHAKVLSQKPLGDTVLPALKTRDGKYKRKSDEANKFILLDKMKGNKSTRRRVAKTHTELIAPCSNLVQRESHVLTAIYFEKVAKEFGSYKVKQFSTSWDPSTYGGANTLVSTVYSPATDTAAYMPNQMVRKVLFGDLDESFLALPKV